MSLHKEVLGAYRGLLKAAKAVFKGDKRMQLGARVNAREAFLKNKDEKDEATLQKMIHDAHDAKAFLYHELIQVNYDANKGKHVAKLEPRHLKDNATGKHVSEI